jgi:peptidoglycan endopeptidase LytE|tara:strand:- start:1156 stop:1521 length:366 start_codon:yes stop_codon:yes gene_type:complete
MSWITTISVKKYLKGYSANSLIFAFFVTLAISGCNSSDTVTVIPTTTPVLTTLRPEMTTTTTEKVRQRKVYVVQPGDTLSIIAKGFEVTVEKLMAENGKETTILSIGEQLVIPPSDNENLD